MTTASQRPSRQARHREATRRRISDAASRLFMERGYEATSLADIAEAADVAVRTIYLHFDSKAAVMLDYFDRWLDAFTEHLLDHPPEEPFPVTLGHAFDALAEAGWDSRPVNPRGHAHPILAAIVDGPPELSGHLLQRWLAVMERIAQRSREMSPDSADSVAPEARAAAAMATWFGTMLVYCTVLDQPRELTKLSVRDVGVRVASVFDGGTGGTEGSGGTGRTATR